MIKCLDGDNLLGRWGHPVTGEVNVPQLVATFPDSDYNDAEVFAGGCSVIRIGGKPYITFCLRSRPRHIGFPSGHLHREV